MEKYFLDVQMLESEKWWGGSTIDGFASPFDKRTKTSRNLIACRNQIMPLYLSNFGRVIWSEAPFTIHFDEGRILIEGEEEITLEKYGNTLREGYLGAMNAHFKPTGNPPLEDFFCVPQYNTWMQLVYEQTQEGVLAYARELLTHGYKPGIMMIDEGWQRNYGDWRFDLERFPTPKKMVDELHEMGFKVMLWVTPYVNPDGKNFVVHAYTFRNPTLKEKYFLRTESGVPAIMKWWNGYSLALDMTKECDRKYLSSQLDDLMKDYGIDGFKFDGGSIGGYAQTAAYGGLPLSSESTAAERNIAWNEFGARYPYHEYKDTFKGGGKRTIQRTLDRNHSWDNEGINTLIPNALLQGLLGHPFICPDMVGGGEWTIKEFCQNIDPELFVRMAQCSALFPMMQFSWAPWEAVDETHAALIKKAHDLHVEFSGFILDLVQDAVRTGEPILRSLEYNYPHCGYEHILDAFMLGESLLVAPVVVKGQTVKKVPLPKGKWKGFDGKLYEGGKTISIPVTLQDLPYFIKTN